MAHKQSYPYPILGENDDIEGLFNPSFWVTLRPMHIQTEYSFRLQNETLEKLIEEKKAEFVVELECKTTFFRHTFRTASIKDKLDLQSERLREKVDVSFYICATQKIPNYRPSGLHADYGDATFTVETGDILADGGRGSFFAEKKFDPMRAPISSFIRIGEPRGKSGPMFVDFDEDYLLIRLSEEDHERYEEAKKHAVQSLHSILVLPALVEALRCMASPEKKVLYGENKWFIRLEAICRDQKIITEDPLDAAQKILGNPITRGLTEILDLSPADDAE